MLSVASNAGGVLFRRPWEWGRQHTSTPAHDGLSDGSGLTAAAAEAEDGERWRVDIAGALVSPLISAPKLELPLRGLPIVQAMLSITADTP